MYNGGNPADAANWSIVGGGGNGGEGVVVGTQRWLFKFSGTESSVGFGITAEQDFIAPADGTITGWGMIVVNAANDCDFSLRYDPFNTDIPVGSINVTTVQNEAVISQAVSQVVLEGDVIAVYQNTTFNPADHAAKMSGFVDFVPS